MHPLILFCGLISLMQFVHVLHRVCYSFLPQWMTAGRGILHSEMPASDGDNIGLQLWINLKAKDKVRIINDCEM